MNERGPVVSAREPIFEARIDASPIVDVRRCPVCDASSDDATLFLDERLDAAALTSFSFASRKVPEFMNHRLVRCRRCDLVYTDRPPTQASLAHAYHVADYDSADEARDAAAAYFRAIEPILAATAGREAALEIGAGSGVFLEYLADAGYSRLVGIEPSAAAIARTSHRCRSWIREAIFDEQDFEPQSFDLVCCFMTMEHVRDPGQLTDAVMRLLKPGGAFITVTHDYRGTVNRLLGKRSPIIDIEHMQLFSKASLRFLFETARFRSISIESFTNRYAIRYWLRLMPLPRSVKHGVDAVLHALKCDRIKVGLNVGNLVAIGFKAS